MVGQVAGQVTAGGLTTKDNHEVFQLPEGTNNKRVIAKVAEDLYFQLPKGTAAPISLLNIRGWAEQSRGNSGDVKRRAFSLARA